MSKINEDDLDPNLPSLEVDGLTFVDASGEQMPPEFLEAIAQAMIASGQAVYNEDGKLVMAPGAVEGDMIAIEFGTDDNGEIEYAESIDVPEEVRSKFRPN